jgi:hypothetical protein
MRCKIIGLFIIAFLCTEYVFGNEPAILDVVTLKNGNGVIKGLITEQVPGETVTINPTEAVIRIKYEDITGTVSKKTIKKDTVTMVIEVVPFRNAVVEGTIIEQSPGKWLTIETKNLSSQTYRYIEIERFGKELKKGEVDIFKAYGIFDVLYLKGGESVRGIIIDQSPGKTVKVKTKTGTVVYAVSDIVKTGKEALDNKRDIFKQSAFLDKVILRSNNSVIKGIITEQTPGQSLKIETVGSSSFVEQLSDVLKLGKEVNPYREELKKDTLIIKVKEPEYLGECLWIKSADSIKPVEKQNFVIGTRNKNLFLINGSDKSTTRFKIVQEISLRVKVNSNSVDPKNQIYIFKIDNDKGTKKRCIDSCQHLFLSSQADRLKIPVYSQFSATRIGNSSFDLKVKITDPGEYAIYVTGCEKSFSLFGVDPIKPTQNETHNHRKR